MNLKLPDVQAASVRDEDARVNAHVVVLDELFPASPHTAHDAAARMHDAAARIPEFTLPPCQPPRA